MATDMPPRRSAGAKALAAARGRLLVDVLPVDAPDEGAAVHDRLRAYAAAGGAPEPVGDLLTGD
jgi:hypothetical protein